MKKWSTRPEKVDFVSIRPPEPKQYKKFRMLFYLGLDLFNEGHKKAESRVLNALIEEIKEYIDDQPNK